MKHWEGKILLISIVILSLLFFYIFPINTGVNTHNESGNVTVYLKILFNGAGEDIFKNISVERGSTVFDVIRDNVDELRYKTYPGMGAYITSIGGVEENKEKGLFWLFYVDGKLANVGVSSYQIDKSINISLSYEPSPW